MLWLGLSLSAVSRRQSFRCQEQQSLLLGEKVYLEEAMVGSSCLGMIHGRISKLLLDIEAEKQLEVELQVSGQGVGAWWGEEGRTDMLSVCCAGVSVQSRG